MPGAQTYLQRGLTQHRRASPEHLEVRKFGRQQQLRRRSSLTGGLRRLHRQRASGGISGGGAARAQGPLLRSQLVAGRRKQCLRLPGRQSRRRARHLRGAAAARLAAHAR